MAGIIAGAGGPDGLHGVAPGATVLPIRVAGWQPAADGRELVYARSDQLLAGLERAVDPNGDGDAHDAVRVARHRSRRAVCGVHRRARGAERPRVRSTSDTLLVAPAGNDGGAGPSFGSVAGPAGGAAALAVGAIDSRKAEPLVRVVLRKGLDVIFDRRLPLVGAAEPPHALTLHPAGNPGTSGVDFFDARGFSLVAGRAVLAPVGAAPAETVDAAARAGAAAVVLYGDGLPPGGLQVAERETAPVVVVPATAALELLAAQRAGLDVGVSIGAASADPNVGRGRVASFSSQGLAFDGSMKPDLVAPGIALATAEPGTAPDGSALYGTINGTSGAAATVAGAAAQLAELRPSLDAHGAAKPSLRLRATGARLGVRGRRRHLAARCVGGRRGGGRAGDTRIRDLEGHALARDAIRHAAQRLDPTAAALRQRDRARRFRGAALQRRCRATSSWERGGRGASRFRYALPSRPARPSSPARSVSGPPAVSRCMCRGRSSSRTRPRTSLPTSRWTAPRSRRRIRRRRS